MHSAASPPKTLPPNSLACTAAHFLQCHECGSLSGSTPLFGIHPLAHAAQWHSRVNKGLKCRQRRPATDIASMAPPAIWHLPFATLKRPRGTSFALINLRRDLHLQNCAHARHPKGKGHRIKVALISLKPQLPHRHALASYPPFAGLQCTLLILLIGPVAV